VSRAGDEHGARPFIRFEEFSSHLRVARVLSQCHRRKHRFRQVAAMRCPKLLAQRRLEIGGKRPIESERGDVGSELADAVMNNGRTRSSGTLAATMGRWWSKAVATTGKYCSNGGQPLLSHPMAAPSPLAVAKALAR